MESGESLSTLHSPFATLHSLRPLTLLRGALCPFHRLAEQVIDTKQEIVVKAFMPTYITKISRSIGDDQHLFAKCTDIICLNRLIMTNATFFTFYSFQGHPLEYRPQTTDRGVFTADRRFFGCGRPSVVGRRLIRPRRRTTAFFKDSNASTGSEARGPGRDQRLGVG